MLASLEERELPILLFELKFDALCFKVDDEVLNEKTSIRVERMVIDTIPQVLLQAQHFFSEYPDAGETIHAIIAVGTFCQDFSISKSRLPPLSQGRLFDPKKYLRIGRILELGLYAEEKSEPYFILNKAKTEFHPSFIRAWSKARKVCTSFQRYQANK